MEPMIRDPRTGEIRWDVVKERAKFYGLVMLSGTGAMILMFLIWWYR